MERTLQDKLIEAVLWLSKKIFNWMNSRSGIVDRKGNYIKANPLSKLISYLTPTHILIGILALEYLICLCTGYLAIFVNTRKYYISQEEFNYLQELASLAFLFISNIPYWFLPIVIGLGVFWLIKKKVHWMFFFCVVFFSVLPTLIVRLVANSTTLHTVSNTYLYERALDAWYGGNNEKAIDLFREFNRKNRDAPVIPDSLGRIAGAQYKLKKYKDSIITIAELLTTYRADEMVITIRTTLRWDLYKLGEAEGTDRAVAFLRKVQSEYGHRELSPIWIGVPPYLAESDSTQFTRLSIDQQDSKKLEKLVTLFPDDYYADFGLYLLNRYDDIIKKSPPSRILDSAMYAKAEESRAHSFDHITNAQNYLNFAEKFLVHPLRSQAYYYAGLEYQKAGQTELFFKYISYARQDKNSFLTNWIYGDIMKVLVTKNSTELLMLHDAVSSLDPSIVEFFNYYIYKQQLVEGKYNEALATLQDICGRTIDPALEVLYCPANIGKVNELIKINGNSSGYKYYLLGKFYLENEYFFILEPSLYTPNGYYFADDQFFIQRNGFLKATENFQRFIERNTETYFNSAVYCLLGKSYESLSYTRSFLPDSLRSAS